MGQSQPTKTSLKPATPQCSFNVVSESERAKRASAERTDDVRAAWSGKKESNMVDLRGKKGRKRGRKHSRRKHRSM